MSNDTFRCANCGFTAPKDKFPEATNLSERILPGDIHSDVECPECGALGFPVERIGTDGGDAEWVCICRNTSSDHGFVPCDARGLTMEPGSGWGGLYRCDKCRRIIDGQTREVEGTAPVDFDRAERGIKLLEFYAGLHGSELQEAVAHGDFDVAMENLIADCLAADKHAETEDRPSLDDHGFISICDQALKTFEADSANPK
jgi:predicted RNA-binding Zn-ribbon protein involved in translation (DUF1610 family)